MKVTYLDPVTPSAVEKKDPRMFQERVRALMAANLNVPMSEYSFGDTSLMFRARKAKLPPRSALLEMDRASRVFGLGVTEAKECLEHFARGAKAEAAAVRLLYPALLISHVHTETHPSRVHRCPSSDAKCVVTKESIAFSMPIAPHCEEANQRRWVRVGRPNGGQRATGDSDESGGGEGSRTLPVWRARWAARG